MTNDEIRGALQCAGFDLTEAKAKHGLSLKHISQLARDAHDAIEIDCPHVALRRLESIIKYSEQKICG